MTQFSELSLGELHRKILACTECGLYRGRTKAVPGDGPENAAIIFIGEAPGWHEDQQGKPFVGPAGQYLDQLLGSIRLKRESVFITNVVKCRPPNNREPLPGEILACRKYLDLQIELLRPKMIVTLGRHSMARCFPNESISKVHGKARKVDGIVYFPMYHPAAALHQGSLRKIIEVDMLKIPQALAEAGRVMEKGSEPQQLSLL
ncbi:MAG: uracil-DNA glycosylase [Chloroflexota bacterium]